MEVVRARHPQFLVLENVRNLAGPRHADTWRVIIDSIREEGYVVADSPTVFSPHLLPPELGGAPQVRERIFILAMKDKASTAGPFEPLLQNKPVARWSPMKWVIDDYLDDDASIDAIERYQLRPEEVR